MISSARATAVVEDCAGIGPSHCRRLPARSVAWMVNPVTLQPGCRQTYDEAAVHWVDCHRKDDGDPRCRLFYDGNSASDCQCPILMATR